MPLKITRHHIIPRSRVYDRQNYPKDCLIDKPDFEHKAWHYLFFNLLPDEALYLLYLSVAKQVFGGEFVLFVVERSPHIFDYGDREMQLRRTFSTPLGRNENEIYQKMVFDYNLNKKRIKAFYKLFYGLTLIGVIGKIVFEWSPEGYYEKVIVKYDAPYGFETFEFGPKIL